MDQDEKIRNLQERLSQIEILNTTDEQEEPSLYTINGVEVLPPKTVGIVAAQKKSGKTNFAGLLMASSAERCHSKQQGSNKDSEH